MFLELPRNIESSRIVGNYKISHPAVRLPIKFVKHSFKNDQAQSQTMPTRHLRSRDCAEERKSPGRREALNPAACSGAKVWI
jgi:hypothetical protein